MDLRRRNRTAATLTLAALLAISPEVFAKEPRTRPRHGQRQRLQSTSAVTLLVRNWGRLVNAWLGEGGQIDPDGLRSTSTPPTPPPPPPPPVDPQG